MSLNPNPYRAAIESRIARLETLVAPTKLGERLMLKIGDWCTLLFIAHDVDGKLQWIQCII